MITHSIRKSWIIFLLFISPAVICSFIGLVSPADDVAARLEQFNRDFPQEKVHLHLERNYLTIGDSLNFKAYIVNAQGNQLSELSNVLYIDVTNIDNGERSALSYEVKNGTASGTIQLPDTSKSGTYLLRAYTSWMRNFSSDFFYQTHLQVGDAINSNIYCSSDFTRDKQGNPAATIAFGYLNGQKFETQNVNYTISNDNKIPTTKKGATDTNGNLSINLTDLKPGETGEIVVNVPLKNGETFQKTFRFKQPAALHDVHFFPEGGNLVSGLTSVVGFKATDQNGKGEAVSGTVVDENGSAVANFQSAFAGMGRFTFKPSLPHRYEAVVKFKDGSIQKSALPTVMNNGYVLTVNTAGKNNIGIQVNGNGSQGSVWLAAQANNKLISFIQLQLANNVAIATLSHKQLPTGIIQLTLFDAQSNPVAERLFFNDLNKQLKVNVNLQKSASANQPVKMSLELTDELLNPISTSLSVAVIDQTYAGNTDTKPASILADLLLTSDLKGNIENPDRYFADRLPATALLLDNLLLTQGWRRFIWKDLLTGKNPVITFPAQANQTITGNVKTDNGVPVQGARVMFTFKGGGAFSTDTITGADGRFTFNLPRIMGRQEFTLIASTAKGDKNIKINAEAEAWFAPLPDAYNTTGMDTTFLNYLAASRHALPDNAYMGAGRKLKEVSIKAIKVTVADKAVTGSKNLNGAGNADQVISYKDLENCTSLDMCLQGKIAGVYFKTIKDPTSKTYKRVPFLASGMNKQMMIVLDGLVIPPDQVSMSSIPAQNIQSIEVLRTGAVLAVYGGQASGGALVITTKTGEISYDTPTQLKNSVGAKAIAHVIFNGYEQNREYYVPPANAAAPRQNGTIFWHPNVQTNDDGKAVIEFKADINIKKIAITIEGLSANGKIASQYETQTIR